MHFWSYVDWFGGVSAAIQFLLALLGIVVSLHEQWAKQHRAWLFGNFLVLGVVGIGLTFAQSAKAGRDSANLSTALGNLTSSTSEISRVTSLNTQLQEKLLR